MSGEGVGRESRGSEVIRGGRGGREEVDQPIGVDWFCKVRHFIQPSPGVGKVRPGVKCSLLNF